jgi:hypothetical protein
VQGSQFADAAGGKVRDWFNKGAGEAWKDLQISGQTVQAVTLRGFRFAGMLTAHMLAWGIFLHGAVREKAYVIGATILEILSGALVGAILGAVPGFPYQINYITVACCSGIGALLGILVSISRLHPTLPEAARVAQGLDRAEIGHG